MLSVEVVIILMESKAAFLQTKNVITQQLVSLVLPIFYVQEDFK